MKKLVMMSGGQDSTICLLLKLQHTIDVEAIGFDYGQKHAVELDQAALICDMLGVPFTRVETPSLAAVSTSSLLGGDGQPGRPASYTPGRNIMFLALAGARAQIIGADTIVFGATQEDADGYPDCRHTFVRSMREALCFGLGLRRPELVIETPLLYTPKPLAWSTLRKFCGQDAVDLVVEHTHSCYRGDRSVRHEWGYGCGECDACLKRAAGWAGFA